MQLTEEAVANAIIWSADVDTTETLLAQVEKMPRLSIVKIDRLFVAKNGYDIFDALRERDKHVFYDAKIVEIPSKSEALAIAECRHQPWMLNCMAGIVSGGDFSHDDPDKIEALMRFADACLSADVRPCAVTVLTSKKPELVTEEFGRSAIDQVLYYVELLVTAGFTDVVCSPAEIEAIRSRFEVDLDINTPGLRRNSSDTGDQARVATLGSALRSGATRGVIGRDLTKGNPAQNFDDIVAEAVAEV